MTNVPKIVFEDNQILVAIKPPGILSQADGGPAEDMLTLLKDDIKIRFQKPGAVYLGLLHRLDQPVGGLMVFARTSKAASRISAQIREHQLVKTYLAVVRGQPLHPQDDLQDYLLKDPVSRNVNVVSASQGQDARLSYQVLQSRPDLDLSLLSIQLKTGRSHQIRVQLASRGWPIVGDQRYGPKSGERLDIALFAGCLGFEHPVSKQWVEFAAQPPNVYPWNLFEPDNLNLRYNQTINK